MLFRLFHQRTAKRFIEELVYLLEEDVPFLEALELLALKQRSKRWKRIIVEIRYSLRSGDQLSGAIARTRAFPRHYTEAIAWGERSGYAADLYRALHLLAGDPAGYRATPAASQTTQQSV